jgi:hypothetical protein
MRYSSRKRVPLYWLSIIALDFCLISIYVPLMRDCLAFASVSGTADMLDECYFYLENSHVYCTCGLARQGIVEFLRKHAEEGIFLDPRWYQALEAFKNNRSIVGFTVEQMVISIMASRGLNFGGNKSIPPAPILAFSGNVTALSADKPSTYYIPLKFNLKAIDALYVAVDKANETAQVVAIQITVAKRHKDSKTAFFAEWKKWINLLAEFTLEVTFMWIVEDKRGMQEMEESLIKLRTSTITKSPVHTVSWVMIDQVDKDLGLALERIRPVDGDRGGGAGVTPGTRVLAG